MTVSNDDSLHAVTGPAADYLVYTSAGDRSNVLMWLEGARNFDLWVTYYGDGDGRSLRRAAKYYNRRKGAKFQNVHDALHRWPDVFRRYKAMYIVDDDIEMTGARISELFEVRAEGDYWVVQPAFTAKGKLSHPVTLARYSTRLRTTNFVENGCALFRADIFFKFMDSYDPVLVGWGIDWLITHALGESLAGRAAVIDSVTCVNPHDVVKGGREVDRLQSRADRIAAWKHFKSQRGISVDEFGVRQLGGVPSDRWPHWAWLIADRVRVWWHFSRASFQRRLVRRLGLNRS